MDPKTFDQLAQDLASQADALSRARGWVMAIRDMQREGILVKDEAGNLLARIQATISDAGDAVKTIDVSAGVLTVEAAEAEVKP